MLFPSSKTKNAQGKVYYGMHFYPGVAQYQEEDSDPYRVFLNEDTIRKMDPTFTGKPIFVDHVESVDPNLDSLRSEADGWVVESFYNAADGKHWVKFIIVSDRGERAIRNGMRLSNAYVPKNFGPSGLWNGVPYVKEITDGEYEHLAIVDNPRYEESVIKTPDEFKQYNEQHMQELKKLSNSNKGAKMNLSFFKKQKVDHVVDPSLQLKLPSGRMVSLVSIIENEYKKDQDEAIEKKIDGKQKNVSGSSDDDKSGQSAKSHSMANLEHMVKMHDGSMMSVADMMKEHKDMKDCMSNREGKELDMDTDQDAVDVEGDLANDDPEEGDMDDHEEKVAKVEHDKSMKDDLLDNPEDASHDDMDEDEKAKKKALDVAEHEDKEIKDAKKKNAAVKAERLRNAHYRAYSKAEEYNVEISQDLMNRGKVRYGS